MSFPTAPHPPERPVSYGRALARKGAFGLARSAHTVDDKVMKRDDPLQHVRPGAAVVLGGGGSGSGAGGVRERRDAATPGGETMARAGAGAGGATHEGDGRASSSDAYGENGPAEHAVGASVSPWPIEASSPLLHGNYFFRLPYSCWGRRFH